MLRSELATLFARPRTRVLLLILMAIPVVYTVVVKIAGGPKDGPAFLGQVPQNGLFAGLAGLSAIAPFVLPLAVAVVAGDAISGEADLGTLRYLLAAPVRRGRLVAVKLLAAVVFACTAALVVAVAGLLAGVVMFPAGPLVTAPGVDPPPADAVLAGAALPVPVAIGMVLLAAPVIGVQVAGLAAVGVFVSTLTNSPVGAIAATVAALFLSEALHAQVSFLIPLQPWLLNSYWDAYQQLFHTRAARSGVMQTMGVSLAYVVVFGAAAWVQFRRTDVVA